MKRPYRCHAKVSGSKYLGVFWAESEEEAAQMAEESEAAGIMFCHQCRCECEDATVEEVYAEEVAPEEAGQ